jgi:phospholipase/carboxylesterase
MLTFDKYVPENAKDGAPVVVLLHGRGSDKDDLMGLQPGLPPDVVLVTPRAPFPGAPWGYGDGWAWYRFLGGTTPEPESFERSVESLAELVGALPELLPIRPGPIIVGGFSQGGTTALGYALTHSKEVDGVLMFSGFLPSHPAVKAMPETVGGKRVFWGHGTADPMMPFTNAIAGREALARAGADLTIGDYPIGHWIDPRELADASRWLEAFRTTPAVR